MSLLQKYLWPHTILFWMHGRFWSVACPSADGYPHFKTERAPKEIDAFCCPAERRMCGIFLQMLVSVRLGLNITRTVQIRKADDVVNFSALLVLRHHRRAVVATTCLPATCKMSHFFDRNDLLESQWLPSNDDFFLPIRVLSRIYRGWFKEQIAKLTNPNKLSLIFW